MSFYAEKINARFAESSPVGGTSESMPKEVIEHALSLKELSSTDMLLPSVEPYIDLDAFGIPDRQLVQTRTLGNFSTRLALGSYELFLKDQSIEPLFALSESDQLSTLEAMAQVYAKEISQADVTLENLLAPTHSEGSFDPLPAITNQFVREEIHRTKRDALTRGDRIKMLGFYVNFLPGSFKQTSLRDRSVGKHDSILVQAFGRNSIKDNELPIIKEVHEQRSDDEMMEYLAETDFQPGDSNIALAKIVDAQLRDDQVLEPVIQWEVAYALWQKDPIKYEQV